MNPFDTCYLALLGAVSLARLVELRVASRNTAVLRAAGAIEMGAGHYPVMVLLHAAFLSSCVVESLARPTPPPAVVAGAALALALATMLRWWVLATLGPRWTTRVLWLTGTPRLSGGPYRFLRHPNYLAVVVEIAALPLLAGAFVTAAVFSVLNGLLLVWRVRVEEATMARFAGP